MDGYLMSLKKVMSQGVIQITPSKFVLKGSREYSLYVAMMRAIPHVGDGLKPSQRIALWLLRNKADKVKTVGLGGLMASERLYVHGDVSATDAIGKLAAPFKNNVPLIEGLGSFGSRTKPVDGIGAPRYTEVHRSKAAEAFLYNDLPIVPLTENYDGSNVMPVHFLPLIPTVLLNGVAGVAVGYSTDILPRHINDLISATQAALMGRKFKEPMPCYERYDITVNPLAPSQYEITGKALIKDTSTIIVTELPPGLSLEAFKKRLIQMEDEDKISNFLDNSSDAINIEVQMKRGSVKGWTPAQAIVFLKLKEKVTERIVVVDWDGERIATYPDASSLIKDFVKWRLAYYEQRFQKYHDDDSYELQYWKLLRALFKAGFTKKLGTFADRAAVEVDVTAVATKAKLKIDEPQIDRAVSLPTYRWTKQFEADVETKIADLEARIKDFKAILADPEKRRAIYNDELEALKKGKFQ
jgi:DNA gyrase/topoisomerase IV subunit A